MFDGPRGRLRRLEMARKKIRLLSDAAVENADDLGSYDFALLPIFLGETALDAQLVEYPLEQIQISGAVDSTVARPWHCRRPQTRQGDYPTNEVRHEQYLWPCCRLCCDFIQALPVSDRYTPGLAAW